MNIFIVSLGGDKIISTCKELLHNEHLRELSLEGSLVYEYDSAVQNGLVICYMGFHTKNQDKIPIIRDVYDIGLILRFNQKILYPKANKYYVSIGIEIPDKLYSSNVEFTDVLDRGVDAMLEILRTNNTYY